MITIYTDSHSVHNPPYEIYDGELVPYAEKSERADTIIAALRRRQFGPIIAPLRFGMQHITAIHHPAYVNFLRERSTGLQSDTILYPSYFISDTYAPVTAGTYIASRQAVNTALTGAKHVVDGEQAVYSLCRPPGHHAAHHTMGGYCYFNNAAIAAHFLSKQGRVAILDIDFHHGNGTQDAFYDRADVLYISIHADPSGSYPYISGFANELGSGQGSGFTLNYPLPRSTNDKQYLRVLRTALKEINRFEPQYLVVSAGFDTFRGDPIGGFQLTKPVYARAGQLIAALKLPTLLIQEGGYAISHLGDLVTTFLSPFM